MSTRSKWVIHRDPRSVELVEVVVDGERIDIERVVRRPGTEYQYDIMEPPQSGEQIGLFGGQDNDD